jgi:hypothetical protein
MGSAALLHDSYTDILIHRLQLQNGFVLDMILQPYRIRMKGNDR